MPSIAPAQQNDSVADGVAKIASEDSKLNQMARTEGLKAANRRGLLNSSMAVGAAQDAVLKNALPIASQDAQQAFQKNQASRAFEYQIATQDDAQAFQQVQPLLDPGDPPLRPAVQHLAPVIQEGLETGFQPHHARRAVGVQHVHIDRETDLEIGKLEQTFHQHFRLYGPSILLL